MTRESYAVDETHLWLSSETKAAYERLRRAFGVDWPTSETPCPARIHVAGYRPTALETLPLKRGTVRRLSLRQPRSWMPHFGRIHIISMQPGPTVCVNCGQHPSIREECPKAPPCRCRECEP